MLRMANVKAIKVFLYLIHTTIVLLIIVRELNNGISYHSIQVASPRDAAAAAAGAGLAGGGAAQL